MIGLNLEGVREGQQGIETLSPCVESVAWEKRSDEPLAWFNRFERYRLLGPQRSLEAASQRCAEVEGQRCPTSSRTWCDASRRWQERAQAWDATQPSPLPGEEEAHRSDARQERLGMISTYPLQKRWIRAPLARRPGRRRARRSWGGGIAFTPPASERQFHVVRCCWRSAAVLSVSQGGMIVGRSATSPSFQHACWLAFTGYNCEQRTFCAPETVSERTSAAPGGGG